MVDQHTCLQPTEEEACTLDTTNPPDCMGLTSQGEQAARSLSCHNLHQDCQKEMLLCSDNASTSLAKFFNMVLNKCMTFH